MEDNFKQELLAEAIRIGDDILDRTDKDEHGFSWGTVSMGENKSVVWNKSEGIYSGASGIILFFMELYKQTNDAKYIEAVKEGARWVEYYCQQNPTNYYAFFTGRIGVSYMMLQVGEFLNDPSYQQKALEIARDCEQFLEMPNGINDLINGASGTIIGLLHLHAATQEKSLLPIIKKFVDRLIESVHFGPKGLYWDRSVNNMRGLCGFSHGASGIGYVFLELGKYFDNSTFYWIAEQSFIYENHFFKEETGNWPDFRKGYFDDKSFKEFQSEYLKENKSFFTIPSNMSAWCHGAPGIGLSRLRAYELLNDRQYEKDINRAISQTYKVTVEPKNIMVSYTACHGGGGNAMLFLEAYRQFGDNKYLEYAEKVGENGLKFIKEHKKYICGYTEAIAEDYSLFMGNAGVGYFYLQLCEPISTPSILKPDVPDVKSKELLDFSLDEVKTRLVNRHFSKTLSLCRITEFEEKESILQSIEDTVNKVVTAANDERISSIFNYECEKLAIINNIEGDSYTNISYIIEVEKNLALIEKLDDQQLLSTTLKIKKEAKLFNTEWDCIELSNTEKDEYYILCMANANSIREHELSQFSYIVLHNFETSNKGSNVLNEITSMYEASSEEEKNIIEESLINQIKEALKSGILVSS